MPEWALEDIAEDDVSDDDFGFVDYDAYARKHRYTRVSLLGDHKCAPASRDPCADDAAAGTAGARSRPARPPCTPSTWTAERRLAFYL